MTSEPIQVDAARGWRMILRRSAALMVGEGAARVVGFVIVLLLARRLGPGGFGTVTVGLTLVAWFTFLADSGTEVLNVREIARRPQRFKEIAEHVLGLRLVLSAVATVLYVAGVLLFARSDFTRSTLVLFALMLPAAALNLRWMVLGVGGSRAIAIGQVLSRIVVLAGVLVFVAGIDDIRAVPLLEAVGAVVYALVVLWLVGGGVRAIRPRANVGVWMSTLRESLPLMVNGMARAATISFDVLIINLVLGPRDVGIYAVASKPAFFVTGLVGLFSLSFLSAFSATAADGAAALKERSLRWAFSIGLLVAAAVCASSLLIPAVFGEAYQDAVAVLAVMAWRIPVGVLGGVYSSILIARDRQFDVMRNSLIVAAFVVVATTVAVLTVGIIGAAAVTVAAGALSYVLNSRSVHRLEPDLAPRARARLGAADS